MTRTALLILPLALLAACSNNTTPTSTTIENAPAPMSATPASAAIDTHALAANHWLLENATDSSGTRIDALFVQADKPLTLDFQEGRVSVSNTCNRINGGFNTEGDTLTVGALASTMMACTNEKLMALDRAVGERIEGALKVQKLDANSLTLQTAKGDVLHFNAEPTAETRYGGAGETVFLEVAAQTKPCTHGVMRDAQCLQTREIHYDDKGLKQGQPGAFENFYGGIEGYTHEPGVRNVLRLKRYTVANPPADGSSRAYVLDMVVESAIEKK